LNISFLIALPEKRYKKELQAVERVKIRGGKLICKEISARGKSGILAEIAVFIAVLALFCVNIDYYRGHWTHKVVTVMFDAGSG
jgi:hypothetical protein